MSIFALRSNGLASSAYKNLSRAQASLTDNISRLASGLRINKTADDSAGSNVSVRMGNQVRGMAQANRNAQDTNNLLATAESGLSDISDILGKMRELSVQASTDTLNDVDRSSIDLEFQALKDELTRIANVTEYNGMNLLNGTYQKVTPDGTVEGSETWDGTGPESLFNAVRTKGTPLVNSNNEPLYINSAGALTAVPQINGSATAGLISTYQSNSVVRSVSFSPNDGLAAYGNDAGQVILLDLEDQTQTPLPHTHGGWVMSVSFSPDGSLLASSDQGTSDGEVIKLWDVENQTQLASLAGHTSSVDSVSFSPDGQILVSASAGGNTIKLWDAETQTEIASLTGTYGVFSPDGRLLVSQNDNTSKLWDVDAETQTEIASLTGTYKAFSPDGSLLVSTNGNTIKLWDAETQTEIASLTGHTSSVHSVSFSPDGRLLASGSNDNTIKLWDIETQTEITSLTGHVGRVDSVSFSPDGQILVSGSGEWSEVSDTLDKTVKTWDLSDFYNRAVIDSEEYVGDYGPNIYDQAQPGTSDSVNQHGPPDNSRGHWRVQIGADNDINSQHEFSITNATANGLDLEDDNVLSVDDARSAITAIDHAIDEVNQERSYVGSEQNKLQFTMSNLSNNIQNIEASRSSIEDADFAAEAADLAKNQILAQSATAMLAQASAISQNVLGLLS